MSKKGSFIILIIIISVGTFFRIYDLNLEGFSPCEEGFNYILSQKSCGDIIDISLKSNQLPFPLFVRKIYDKFIIINKKNSRLLSSFFGILTIIALYFLAEYLFNSNVALLSSLLLSISTSHILHSRIIREYSLLSLVSTLFIFFFFKYLRERKLSFLIAANFFLLISLYTHYVSFAFFIIIPFITFLELRNLKKSLLISATILVSPFFLFLPWLIMIIMKSGNPIFHLYDSSCPAYIIQYGFSSFKTPLYFFSVRDRILFLDGLIILTAIPVSLLLFNNFLKIYEKKSTGENIYMNLIFFIPLLLAFLSFNLLGRDDIYKARYLFFVIAPFMIILANSIMDIKNKKIKILVITSIVLLSILNFYNHINCDDEFKTCEKSFNIIKKNYDKDSIIVIEPPLIADIFKALPNNCNYLTFKQKEIFGSFSSQYIFSEITNMKNMEKKISGKKKIIYYFYPYFDDKKTKNLFREFLDKKYKLIDKKEIISSTIYMYEKNSDSGD